MSSRGRIGLVAGSGIDLAPLLDHVDDERAFDSFPGLRIPAVEGHQGRFLIGRCGDQPIVLQQGRLHFYEGYSYREVTRAVDAMHELGVETVLFTNAAGGLNTSLAAGALMSIERVQCWPFARWTPDAPFGATDFVVSGTDARGSYCWVHGPTYETRAEIRALRAQRADAVGMSTVPELARCAELAMQAGAIACITNDCLTPHTLSHKEVVCVAAAASRRLVDCVRSWLKATG